MSKIPQGQLLIPSILDRLIDDDPTGGAEVQDRSRYQNLRELKLSVQRDLQNLLNTRWRQEIWPDDLVNLKDSVINYGMPDFSNENFDDPDKRKKFVRRMEQVIKRFESRFEQVTVQLIYEPDEVDRTVRFRIDALLKADPMPEPVTYDSDVEPASGTFKVTTATP